MSKEAPNPYLNFLTDPSFQGVNRFFYHLKIRKSSSHKIVSFSSRNKEL